MYRSVLTTVLLTLSTVSFAQTFSYAPINIPGALATEARGINNNGEVVGFYYTSKSCVEPQEKFNFPTVPFTASKLSTACSLN
jgi:hypothetical protein